MAKKKKTELDLLAEQVSEGNAVLFLGAGASIGAKHPKDDKIPNGDELRDALSARFLSGKFGELSLAELSEIAIHQAGLLEVQGYVRELFLPFTPAEHHLTITEFPWRAIATTNYDLIIERAYENSDNSAEISRVLSNEDKFDKAFKTGQVPLFKLHGCIDRSNDEDLPLILTPDQYARYKKNRDRLFSGIQDLGAEYTFIFVGYRLQDPNFRSVLANIEDVIGPSRPEWYLVAPAIENEIAQMWRDRHISPISLTGADFFEALQERMSPMQLGLAGIPKSADPIAKWIAEHTEPSDKLRNALGTEWTLLHEGLVAERSDPKQFYKGFDLGWFSIQEELDVRRSMTDDVLYEVALKERAEDESFVEFFVVKAEAGAGKSVFLKRIAWESCVLGEALCLFLNRDGDIETTIIDEICRLTKEVVYLFVDDASARVVELKRLIEWGRQQKYRLVVVCAERQNEWNVTCGDLDTMVDQEFRLRYLSRSEITGLVEKLDKYDSLGPNLSSLNSEDRINEFEKRAGRQLLVALHEATLGIPFEEILENEYENITPEEAKRLYLTVCVLNRLGVPVRAGLIWRTHGIRYREFAERMFLPLEHVVQARKSDVHGDMEYFARHSEIAEIVFDRVLTDPSDRLNEYLTILGALNSSYSSDQESLTKLMKGRSIVELFPDYQDAIRLYEKAREVNDDPHLMQQEAIFERLRPNGNLSRSVDLLVSAHQKAQWDKSIVHTLAETLRAAANKNSSSAKRNALRRDAKKHLSDLSSNQLHKEYAAGTLALIGLDELRDQIANGESEHSIEEKIRDVEKQVSALKRKFPQNEFAASIEANFAALLKDDDRTTKALKRANQLNPKDAFLALRLAKRYLDEGASLEAQQVLEAGLEQNRGDQNLNFAFAELLRKDGGTEDSVLAYHYRRAFHPTDDNYEAQFWWARYVVLGDDEREVKEANRVFNRLRKAQMPYETRIRIRDMEPESRRFSGSVRSVGPNYCLAQLKGSSTWLLVNKTDFEDYSSVKVGRSVEFSVAFSYSGLIGQSARVLD